MLLREAMQELMTGIDARVSNGDVILQFNIDTKTFATLDGQVYQPKYKDLVATNWEFDYSPVPVPKQKEYSAYQFRELFTLEEKVALYKESETDIILKIFREDLITTNEVNLEYKSTIQGMQYLVLKNIITQERYNEIMQVEN